MAALLFEQASRYDDAYIYKRAFTLFLKAAELGDEGAQINLGNYYASGKGTTKDLSKAAYWYKRAYNAGCSTGALNLAIDKKNNGDTRSAILWFKKAIAMNDGWAYCELAKLYAKRRAGKK